MGLKKTASKISDSSPCASLRAAYNDCFNRWYAEKFTKGQWDKQECVAEWDRYRACLLLNVVDMQRSQNV